MADVINKSVLSIPVFFEKIEETDIADDRFTKVKVYLMHTGLNYNQSIFDKQVVENAIPTLEYIPIVGFIEDNGLNEKDFTDHRYIITKDEKGLRRKYIGQAYGVIKASDTNNAQFEMRMCDDGVEREFLCVEGLMWNMFEDSSDIMNRDLIKNHSMELYEKSVEGYEDENKNFHFTKFSFRAACILGDNKQPAMQNSTVEVQFTMSDFMKNIQSELNDKYTTFMSLNVEKEGKNIMDKNSQNSDFTLSIMQQFDNISAIVRDYETTTDRWGDKMARYSLVDIQDNEVIVVDRQNHYQYYGFTFTINGDAPTIDFKSGVRKKIEYTNYEDGTTVPEGAFDFGTEIESIETKAFSKVESANQEVIDAKQAQTTAETNYSQIKADYDEMKPKYDEYVKAEQDRITNEINTKKDEEFSRYEEMLKDNADFIALKENKANLSLEEITNQCSVLYTRVDIENKKLNYSKSNNQSLTAGVLDINDDGNTDGFVTTKYGNIPVRH